VTIPEAVASGIIQHAMDASPAECCGLLVGDDARITSAFPSPNIAADATRQYLVDPQHHLAAIRQARALGLQVVGAYHSHPRSRAVPSPTDARDAFTHFLFVIVGLGVSPPEITAWHWGDGNFIAVPLVRVP
jgi:proteasome lid subunit RPN8/RPN11